MEPVLQRLCVPGPAARGGGPRHLAWWWWNATGCAHPPRVVVCVHGLTRQARDFDVLAQALAPHMAVAAVDVAGRGESDWLDDPMAYQLPTYVADLMALVGHLRQRHALATGGDPLALTVDWVGTSMGGLIGMAVAAQPAAAIHRLVLNDVGPVIEPASLERIALYVGADPVFATVEEAADALWAASPTFGPHTREQWLALTRPMLRPAPGGGWRLHYDPALAIPFRAMVQAQRAAAAADPRAAQLASEAAAQAGEAMLWALYDAIGCPTLLLRGAESDLLSRATALAMTQRGPRARLVEFAGVGHAPTLVQPDQVRAVRDFLLEP
ncbi:2-succinyl-6-hydroxy-2,4-cyclohexadiene-1-carboxylate synthase [Tepidimonas alkaliphilus]|uniref:2-succinyl-6-hydroxy-2, 4-cyclohexadiene-1-carboxylate synthase n=1 Tax=Tepidimonas alkaliphilus TaxID=2588942 RepID=A0A554WDQ4_9BURK|nr:alpha/beta hydrolase [Tepidimonas alkaliphilus]TSE21677.1 2-succinyl-6-hydroxy-2,4-cyclohexadiene-1-carboxylate synthase [Tepidimonas alkaliphilus]